MKKMLLVLLLLPLSASAQEVVRAAKVQMPDAKERCQAPLIQFPAQAVDYPGENAVANTTNLRRPTGIAVVAAGDRISFTGKIVDSGCVPVPDASVEIWQVDSVGNKKSRDPNFIGSGRMYTDNEGNFAFLTIFPGNYANRAPHINFRITHPDFKESFGAVFFELHPANGKDSVYKAYERAGGPIIAEQRTPPENQRLTDRLFHAKIVLKGRSAFRRF